MKILILFIFSAKALPFIQRGVFRKSCGRKPDEVYSMWDICEVCDDRASCLNIISQAHHWAHKSRTTHQNKVRLKVLPEQLTLFVNTSVAFKKCTIQ